MNKARWREVQAVFHAVFEADPAEQAALLESLCGSDADLLAEVATLLEQAARTGAFLETPALQQELESGRLRGLLGTLESAGLPERIGEFRIIERIGSGGMGLVFRAEQEQPRRQVALKLLRGGWADASGLARFAHEAHILGRLRHSGIVPVYAAGTITIAGEERPYFALELVEGVTLREFADRQPLSIPAIVELLSELAEIVHAAHQQGVIHRDLKPANIMIVAAPGGRPRPKVLDFGVARLLEAEGDSALTREIGALLGTPAYMSPEQLDPRRGPADIRSDVYALGVIAYELFSGQRPRAGDGGDAGAAAVEVGDAGAGAVAAQAEALAPGAGFPPLGRVRPELRGDIETIVAKALAIDKEQRYASAAELAADLRRHQQNLPILARSPSLVYSLRKFAMRQRALVFGALFALAGLIVGSVIAVRSAVEALAARDAAQQARSVAEEEAEIAAAVTEFLKETLASADPGEADRAHATIRDALAKAERELSPRFKSRPHVEADIRLTIGKTYLNLGLHDRANENLLRAKELQCAAGLTARRALLRAVSILHALAMLERDRDRLSEAVIHLDEAFQLLSRPSGDSQRDMATTLYLLGLILHRMGEVPAALEVQTISLADRVALWGSEHVEVADSLDALGIAFRQLSRFAEAETCYQEGLRLRRIFLRPDHPTIGHALHNIGLLLKSRGHFPAAEAAYCEALEIQQRAYAGPHPITALYLRNLSHNQHALGRLKEALQTAQNSYDMYRALYREGNSQTAIAAVVLARIASDVGDSEKAARWVDEALRQASKTSNRVDRMVVLSATVPLLLATQRLEEAEEASLRRLADLRAIHGGDNIDISHTLMTIGEVRMRRGHFDAAREVMNESVALRRRLLGERHPTVAEGVHNLAFLEWQAGKLDRAVELFEDAIAQRGAILGDDHPDTWKTRLAFGRVLAERHDDTDAVDVLSRCLDFFRRSSVAADAIRVSDCAILLGAIDRRRGAPSSAQVRFETTLAHVSAVLGHRDRRLRPLLQAAARASPGWQQVSIAPLLWQWDQWLAEGAAQNPPR